MLRNLLIAILISQSVLCGCSGADPGGLKPGDKAPPFTAVTNKGDTVSLDSLLKNGPLVLVFYRGAWCPHCSRHLQKLQDSLGLILEKGAGIIAISPEATESQEETVQKTGASFPIIHDKDHAISKAYRVTFTPSKMKLFIYRLGGINLKKINNDSGEILPVPATYIIGQDGRIRYAHYNTDFTNRASVKEILENL